MTIVVVVSIFLRCELTRYSLVDGAAMVVVDGATVVVVVVVVASAANVVVVLAGRGLRVCSSFG